MATDIQLDDKGDLLLVNGDLVIGLSDEQHIKDLMLSRKGEFKQSPLSGIDIEKWLKSPLANNSDSLLKEIRLQLEFDGAKNIAVDLSNGKINVTANYEENN